MKRFLASSLMLAMVLGLASVASATDLGGFNNMQPLPIQNPLYDMQQLENEYRAKQNSIDEFQSFEKQKKARQEQIKKENERQQYLEERAIRTKSTKQFVNDNGVIKIENAQY